MARLVALDPFQKPSVVDRHQVDEALCRRAGMERREDLVQEFVGRAPFPSRGSVEVRPDAGAVGKLRLPHALGRGPALDAQGLRQVLEERGLAVARVAAQDHQAHYARLDVALQRGVQAGVDVCQLSELGIEPARLAVAVARAGIDTQDVLEPRDLVLAERRRRRYRRSGRVRLRGEQGFYEGSRRDAVRKCLVGCGSSRTITEPNHLRIAGALLFGPGEPFLVCPHTVVQERLATGDGVVDRRRQSEQIVGEIDRPAGAHRGRAKRPGALPGHRLAPVSDQVVVDQGHVCAVDQNVARAYVAVHQSDPVEGPERRAQVTKPREDQCLRVGLA